MTPVEFSPGFRSSFLPLFPLVRYQGVFGAHSSWRALFVARARDTEASRRPRETKEAEGLRACPREPGAVAGVSCFTVATARSSGQRALAAQAALAISIAFVDPTILGPLICPTLSECIRCRWLTRPSVHGE